MIYIISNERLDDEVAYLYKIEDEAGGREQELAPPSKNTDEHRANNWTDVSGLGTVEAYI